MPPLNKKVKDMSIEDIKADMEIMKMQKAKMERILGALEDKSKRKKIT